MADPVTPAPQPSPNEKLLKVFDTEQETEAMVVKGLLESAGIDVDLKSIDAVQETFPGVGGSIILVREEDAGEAKKSSTPIENCPRLTVTMKLPTLLDECDTRRNRFPVQIEADCSLFIGAKRGDSRPL